MTKDQAIENIKSQLKKLMKFETTQKFTDVMLVDGTKLATDSETLEVGSNVYHLDDQGTQTPCEDGTYELEDGRTITVKGGVVDSISETPAESSEENPETPANPASTATDTPMAADPSAAAPSVSESPADESAEEGDIVARVNAIEEQISQILEILQGMSNMQEQTMSKVEEFAASPAEEPIKEKKVSVNDAWTKSKQTYNAHKNEIDELKSIIAKSNNSNYGSFTIGN